MIYNRVIPRDFFNEAKLLKCLGRLSLLIVDKMVPKGINIEIEGFNEPFDIRQEESDASLFVINYFITVNDKLILMKTIYNSKDNYPLLCVKDGKEIRVFNEQGNFTKDFILEFRTKKQCKTCNEFKLLDDFYTAYNTVDKKFPSCKSCRAKYMKDYNKTRNLLKRNRSLVDNV